MYEAVPGTVSRTPVVGSGFFTLKMYHVERFGIYQAFGILYEFMETCLYVVCVEFINCILLRLHKIESIAFINSVRRHHVFICLCVVRYAETVSAKYFLMRGNIPEIYTVGTFRNAHFRNVLRINYVAVSKIEFAVLIEYRGLTRAVFLYGKVAHKFFGHGYNGYRLSCRI